MRRLRALRGKRPYLIEVDGSIDDETGRLARRAGADVFVSGGYLLKDLKGRLPILRKALEMEDDHAER